MQNDWHIQVMQRNDIILCILLSETGFAADFTVLAGSLVTVLAG